MGRLKQEDLEFKANLSKQQDLDSKVSVCVWGGESDHFDIL